jgi:hypothetical protein
VTAVRDGHLEAGAQVTAQFWAPGKDPEHDPAVRAHPDHCATCLLDPNTRRYVAEVSTEGWAPGTWTARGLVGGEATGWGWRTFSLAP